MNEIKALEADTKAQEEADKETFQTREAQLKDELAKLTAELTKGKEENHDTEEKERKKKVKNESEVDNWITKYDQDMLEKDTEITERRAIYEEEKKELARLEDYFNKLMVERETQLAEERKKAEELARVQAQQATLNKAATMMQKLWRGRIARRDLEKKRGKGKGKGKGKKKK